MNLKNIMNIFISRFAKCFSISVLVTWVPLKIIVNMFTQTALNNLQVWRPSCDYFFNSSTYRDSTCLLAFHTRDQEWLQVTDRNVIEYTCRPYGASNMSFRNQSPWWSCCRVVSTTHSPAKMEFKMCFRLGIPLGGLWTLRFCISSKTRNEKFAPGSV